VRADLAVHQWPSTGIWAQFIRDVHGGALFEQFSIVLFIMNDLLSNFIIKIPVHLDTTLFGTPLSVGQAMQFAPNRYFVIYPNPATSWAALHSAARIRKVRLFNLLGRRAQEWEGTNIRKIDLKKIPPGLYFIQAKLETGPGQWKTLVQKIIRR
jgi:hypothetical protein